MKSRRMFITGAAGFLLAGLALPELVPDARAGELAKPAGNIVLTVDGSISRQNAEGRADFDIDMLRAMPAVTIRTATPWTDGLADFEGVLIADIVKAVGASGKSIKAAALNDYVADVNAETAVSAGAILAYRLNGAEISVRDKGPLWIMFPFDQDPELRSETVYSQSVWQLRKLTFLD